MNNESTKIADKYRGALCTINGHPAKICGRPPMFATVAALDTKVGISAEWSWHGVESVMAKGGNFWT